MEQFTLSSSSKQRVIRSHSLNAIKTTNLSKAAAHNSFTHQTIEITPSSFEGAVFYLDLPKTNQNVKKIISILQGKLFFFKII